MICLWYIVRNKPKNPHMQIIFIPKLYDLLHHRCAMMHVNRILTCPTVDQQNCFGILHGIKILILKIPFFIPDGGNSTA